MVFSPRVCDGLLDTVFDFFLNYFGDFGSEYSTGLVMGCGGVDKTKSKRAAKVEVSRYMHALMRLYKCSNLWIIGDVSL